MKFNSMFGPGVERTGLDYSNTKEPIFTEIPPYTKDSEGNWLNDTSFPKIIKTGYVDVQEKIQSFADDVDIYKILERFAYSGDTAVINRSHGVYSDITNIPDNLHSFSEYVGKNLDTLKNIDSDLAKAILNEDSTESDIAAAYNKSVAKKVAADKAVTDTKIEKKEEV